MPFSRTDGPWLGVEQLPGFPKVKIQEQRVRQNKKDRAQGQGSAQQAGISLPTSLGLTALALSLPPRLGTLSQHLLRRLCHHQRVSKTKFIYMARRQRSRTHPQEQRTGRRAPGVGRRCQSWPT